MGIGKTKVKNMKLASIAITIVLGFASAGAFSVSAQPKNTGKLNTWTTRSVERLHETTEHTYIKVVRAANQKGFDRIVFEFEGPMPNFNIKYHPSRFYEDEGGRHRIKIAGNTFVEVHLHVIPVDEQQLKFSQAEGFVPKGRLTLPMLWEVEEAGFFEGYYEFLLGVKSRKGFRVTELANPSRLVIDFKH
jgi:hypothetical protein